MDEDFEVLDNYYDEEVMDESGEEELEEEGDELPEKEGQNQPNKEEIADISEVIPVADSDIKDLTPPSSAVNES